ncbi:hypothetical protein DL96DRAFT_1677629 [Flagelloscypha sp. PMI_526]|nr:hypothetical protein DL96DRAFT_1677629 [Flagelloscypha sp. PMI_526]
MRKAKEVRKGDPKKAFYEWEEETESNEPLLLKVFGRLKTTWDEVVGVDGRDFDLSLSFGDDDGDGWGAGRVGIGTVDELGRRVESEDGRGVFSREGSKLSTGDAESGVVGSGREDNTGDGNKLPPLNPAEGGGRGSFLISRPSTGDINVGVAADKGPSRELGREDGNEMSGLLKQRQILYQPWPALKVEVKKEGDSLKSRYSLLCQDA